MLYGLLEKRAQNFVTAVRRPYGLYGPLNAPFSLEIVLLYGQNRKLNVAVPNPYRTDLSSLLAASKSVP
jgi:hypothetical protein